MAVLFCDGFESGDFSAWSSYVNDADFTVSGAAAIEGSYGASLVINGLGTFYVTDTTPNSETRYRFRFLFDPNGITFPSTAGRILILGSDNNSVQVRFGYYTGMYRLHARAAVDGGGFDELAYVGLSDSVHDIEVDWKASSAPGSNNGFLYLWANGILIDSNTSIDNDTKVVGLVDFGNRSINDATISGTYFLDSFCSNNDGDPIGWVVSESPSRSPSPSLSISPSASISVSPSISRSASESPSVSRSASRSVSASASRSVSPSISPSPSVAPSAKYGPKAQFMA